MFCMYWFFKELIISTLMNFCCRVKVTCKNVSSVLSNYFANSLQVSYFSSTSLSLVKSEVFLVMLLSLCQILLEMTLI